MSAWPSQTSRTGAPSAHVTGAVFPHPPLGPQKMPPKMDAVPPKMDAECVTCRKRHRAALTLPVCVCARACVCVCECVSAFVNNVYIHARAITTGVLSTYTCIHTSTCACVCIHMYVCVITHTTSYTYPHVPLLHSEHQRRFSVHARVLESWHILKTQHIVTLCSKNTRAMMF